jgi:hypothetical protein
MLVLPEVIRVAMEAVLADLERHWPGRADVVALARQHGVVPEWLSDDAFAGINFDGRVVFVEFAPPHAVIPVREDSMRRGTLNEVATRYPSLQDFKPERPADAVACAMCQGSGVIEEGRCLCFGLGWWLPKR